MVVFFVTGVSQGQPVQWTIASGGNGHWYEAVHVPEGVSWDEAQAIAVSQGGYLATVVSSAENQWVFQNVANDPILWLFPNFAYGPLLGGIRVDSNGVPAPPPAGQWTWVTGEPWSFSNWGPGEPFGSSQHWLNYWGFNGTTVPVSDWDNGCGCSGLFISYIIEFDAFFDCNNNGIFDLIDIATGFSLDCNVNQTPDECELAGNDCNTNSIPDDCDIDTGTSQDVNGSGTPDECDCLADIAPIDVGGTHGNGVVNIDDLVQVLNSFGQTTPPGQPTNIGDINYNGVVNIDDLVDILNSFGLCP